MIGRTIYNRITPKNNGKFRIKGSVYLWPKWFSLLLLTFSILILYSFFSKPIVSSYKIKKLKVYNRIENPYGSPILEYQVKTEKNFKFVGNPEHYEALKHQNTVKISNSKMLKIVFGYFIDNNEYNTYTNPIALVYLSIFLAFTSILSVALKEKIKVVLIQGFSLTLAIITILVLLVF